MSASSSRKPYRVGRSRTGLGLFATAPIAKGTEIIQYLGRMLDCRKKEDDAIENKYLFQINGRWTIDGSNRSNTARYINHACRPNAESDVNQRKRTVTIRAIKNIAPGDEINYDYGTEYFKAYLKPIGCKCDACERKRARERGETPPAKRAANGKAAPAAAKGRTAAKTTAKTAAKTTAKSKTAKAGAARSKVAGVGARKATTAKANARSAAARGAVGVKSVAGKAMASKTVKKTAKAAKPAPAAAAARAATATRTSAATRRKTATSKHAPSRKA